MSLSLLNPLPDPMHKVRELQREIDALRERLRQVEESAHSERAKTAVVERGVSELRNVLNPLYTALRHIYGEIDAMEIEEQTTHVSPKKSAVWENWKSKLGGLPAKAIDALLLNGPMNRTQLRIQLGCATGSVTNVIVALNKAGLIDKDGTKVKLKEL